MHDCVLGGHVGTSIFEDGRRLLFFGGNDYLGLAGSGELEAAAIEAVHRFGVSSCASRTTTGTNELHLELEERLAGFRGSECARVIGAGYLANRILLSVLLKPGGTVFCEKTVHPSAQDGIPRDIGRLVLFSRDDVAGFEQLVKTSSPADVVLLDGVSTTGEIAPLDELMPSIRRYGLQLLVDDAHGIGVIGPGGRGTAASFGLDPSEVVEAASMSKGFGSYGGFITGTRSTIDRVASLAPAYIGATALPPAVLGASLKATELVLAADDRRQRLRHLTQRVQRGFCDLGYEVSDHGTPILIFGEGEVGRELHEGLLRADVLVPHIQYPDPGGPCRIRLTLSAGHSDAQVDELLAAAKAL